MSYYRYSPDADNYLLADCDDRPIAERLFIAYQTPASVRNNIPHLTLAVVGKGKKTDFPAIVNVPQPLLSDRAWKILQPLCDPEVEAIPATLSGDSFWLIHFLHRRDVIDMQRSLLLNHDAHYFRYVRTDRYAFRPNALAKYHLCSTHAGTLVDDHFRQTVEQHKLKGLLFNPLAEV